MLGLTNATSYLMCKTPFSITILVNSNSDKRKT